ncbi:MAG: DNA repair protein RadA [Deltaproteobacteria bacterium RIFOXYB12_FULL_58_9]|nr:MAG: DNA repair protein RadA [Deltaproteobacteria bacterium RIFOXYB12_FULL_58_9]
MKSRSVFVCQSCGHQEHKWLGRCPACNEWSTFVEEVSAPANSSAVKRSTVNAKAIPLTEIETQTEPRRSTGIAEFDRVLGGGIVPGALMLVGGDPGIGKSTLLLQAAGELASGGARILYVTAEESLSQVKLRADRLGISSNNLFLLAETQLESVDEARESIKPEIMIIDSIQTVGVSEISSAIGSVSQIRAATAFLMGIAKGKDVPVFVVGHVTKEGTIAGPKVMEHMVDTVLYFEGERTGPYRILRAHKNRFGSAQEIGVFEMHGEGLRAVSNPSELFLSQRASGPGAAVVTSLEGSRPILLEVQALTTPAVYGTPRRTTVGFDHQRVTILCAVLDRRCGLDIGGLDVYVNIAGGVRVTEPAVDLGVALALASTVRGVPIPADVVVAGEVGLSGEVRAVSQLGSRVQEAASLGFSRCVVPNVDVDRWKGPAPVLPLCGVGNVMEALAEVGLTKGR